MEEDQLLSIEENKFIPEPAFQLLSRDKNRNYCEVCCKSWDKKSGKRRSKFVEVNTDKFREVAFEW